MKQRVITAIALLVLLAVVIWQIYTPFVVVVVAFLASVAAYEIMKCAKISNRFILITGTAFAAVFPFFTQANVLEPIISSADWFKFINAVPKVFYIVALIIAFFLAMLKDYKNTKFEQVAIALVASIIVPSSFSILVILRDITGFKTQFGIYTIFYALICALATDVGAQLGGMAIGKTKMAPNISPKKTVEGAVCGIVFGLILNAIALTLYNHFAVVALTRVQATVFMAASPFIQFMSMMGDLTASVLKRNFGVKDFGKIFPGHGGVMDRFDSVLFSIPLTYCVATFIV